MSLYMCSAYSQYGLVSPELVKQLDLTQCVSSFDADAHCDVECVRSAQSLQDGLDELYSMYR